MPKFLLLSLVFFLGPSISMADTPTQKGVVPIEFNADSIDINNKIGEGHYQGHVLLRQGDKIMTAARADSTQGPDHKLAQAVAHTEGKTRPTFEAQTQKDQEKMHATANTITYITKTKQVILQGNAIVTQGPHQVKAPTITYDLDHDQIHFEHGSYIGKEK